MLRSAALVAALVFGLGGCEVDNASEALEPSTCARSEPRTSMVVTHYHGTRSRSGHNDDEVTLRPDELRRHGLMEHWVSARFDEAVIDGRAFGPISYASPLYADGVRVSTSGGDATASVVFAATNTGWVYAVAAAEAPGDCALEPGQLLWRTSVVEPVVVERLDGGVPLGVLSTPVLDVQADPPRIYVAGLDAVGGWQVTALDLYDGQPLPGWPVTIDDQVLAPVNRNGPARFWEPEIMAQRGALQLSESGDQLYVAFGTFWGEGTGWLVAVQTAEPQIAAAFSSAPSSEPLSNGGIWGSAGPAVDDQGRVWLTTGNSPPGSERSPGVWGNSLLQLSSRLALERAYSPFNYCVLDEHNMDLGASQPLLLPPISSTSTPELLAFGGKQGNVYLVDRRALPAAGDRRGPCSSDASADGSLLPPEVQPQFGTRGPLNVFGPYSDFYGQIDHAKMRTKLASWRDGEGGVHLLATGSTKRTAYSTDNVAPSIARLSVVTPADEPAWLRIGAVNPDVVMENPGSPVVTSDGGERAVVWVVDRNAPRTASFVDPQTPGPVVYAFDARTLELLWRSEPEQLGPMGKYGTPIVVDGQLLLATDRIQAFGRSPAWLEPEREPVER